MSSTLPLHVLRVAGALAIATTLAACQTNTVGTPSSADGNALVKNPAMQGAAQNKVNQNPDSKDDQQSSALSMDMSGRHEYQLENGLKIVVKEDHRAPVAMTQIWYRVGSTDEPLDKGGLSHLLEHMMFKGTSNVPVMTIRVTTSYSQPTACR